MKDLLTDMLEDLALFGLACSLALQAWVGIVLLVFYAVAIFISGEVILAVILGVLFVLLVWRKLHVQISVKLEEEDND